MVTEDMLLQVTPGEELFGSLLSEDILLTETEDTLSRLTIKRVKEA